MIIGDSITEGFGVAREHSYPVILQKKFADSKLNEVKVEGLGIGGSTTASAPGRVKWSLKSNPNIVILALGANDGLRGLKVEDSFNNLESAILLLKQAKVRVILAGMRAPPNYGKDYTEKFEKMFFDLAKKHSVPLIPFLLDKVAGEKKYNQADGIHPNELGNELIAENFFKAIKGLL